MRTVFLGCVAALALGCSDDSGSSGDTSGSGSTSVASTDTTTSPTGPGSTGTDPGSTTDDPPNGTTSVGSSSEGGSSESGVADGSSSSSSGGAGGPIVLQNDVWKDNTPTSVQGGFVAGECWGSTYVPEPDHYPFRLEGFQVVISGDEEDITEPFEVGVWTVDVDNRPETQIATAMAEFTSTNSAFNGADFAVLEVDEIIIDEGNFAISMCLVEHDGFPAIATDTGNNIIDDRNWLFTGGEWSQSADFLLTGNWIMRAIIEPQ